MPKDPKASSGFIVEDARGVSPDGKKYLDISIIATHSGLLNLNTRFYIPSRMRDGAPSLINENKPIKILKNHTADEAYGIVLGAEYIDTTPDQLQYNRDVQILNDSSASIEDQLVAARNFIKDGIPFLDGWEGLGYIKIRARILDEKTIGQIESGLFDSVSTSFRSQGMYCSVCGGRWEGMMDAMFGGGCGHVPGGLYPIPDDEEKNSDTPEEKVFCCLIPDYHSYHECSLVVYGADPITVININDSAKDSLSLHPDKIKQLLSCKPSETVGFVFSDNKEDIMVPKNKPDNDPQSVEDKAEVKFSYKDMLSSVSMAEHLAIDKLEGELASLPDSAFCGPDRTFPVPDRLHYNAAMAYLESCEDFDGKDGILEKVNEKAALFDSDEELEDEKELKLMLEEGLLTEEQYKDAKLSAEERKKLPESAFCGPDRSFPVPDCAHVTAARRLLGRYEGPGDKDKISACIERKAKAMSCDSNKSKDTEAEKPEECLGCKKLSEELAKSEDNAKRLADHSRVLRKEWNDSFSDYRALFDKHVAQKLDYEKHLSDLCAIISVVNGENVSTDEAKEKLLASDNLLELKEKLVADFDITKIADKISDGMDSQPKEKIENPADTDSLGDSSDESTEEVSDSWKETVAAKMALREIEDRLTLGEEASAREYFESIRNYKIFPKDFEFESLVKK